MAKPAQRNQGTKWYIGTQAADATTDTYTQIKRTVSVGAFGPQASSIDATALEDLDKVKLKGIPDNGQVTLRGRRIYDDDGQAALKAAADLNSDDPFNFRCRIPNARTGVGTPDHLWTVQAIVLSFRDNIGGVDGLIEFEATIDITGPMVEAAVAAA